MDQFYPCLVGDLGTLEGLLGKTYGEFSERALPTLSLHDLFQPHWSPVSPQNAIHILAGKRSFTSEQTPHHLPDWTFSSKDFPGNIVHRFYL